MTLGLDDYVPPLAPEVIARRRRRFALVVLAVVAVAWVTGAAIQAVAARRAALAGLDELERVRAQATVDGATDRSLVPSLGTAAIEFEDAYNRLRSPVLAPLRMIPLVRTQLQSADALSRSAFLVSSALADAGAEVADLAEAAPGMGRVAVAGETLSLVQRARSNLTGTDLGPDRWLAGPLADARTRFATELGDAQQLLLDAETAAAGLAEFLEGPTSYLLLAANNSEMRAGSGSFLQVGVLDVVNGAFDVRDLQSAGNLLLQGNQPVISDPDLADRWGWLEIASDFRNLAASPRFPPNAELAADMWQAATGESVDGAIVLDPVALAAIMSASGPVDLDGRTIAADGVLRELLFDQYWEDDVAVRRDRLAEIASAALATLDNEEIDLVTLARELQNAASSRHVLAWSRIAAHQAAWEAVEIDGSLTADSVMVSVVNLGANKLDTFLSVESVIQSEPVPAGYDVTITVTLTNNGQLSFPDYVLGPAEAFGYPRGAYVGLLAVNVPGDSRRPHITTGERLDVDGPDGASYALATPVEVEAGESIVHQIQFEVAASELRIEPSARVPGVAWTTTQSRWLDGGPVVVDLSTGRAEGGPVAGALEPVTFELDPVRNPVAPIPNVALNGDAETTVEVGWTPFAADPAIDLWERRARSDWQLLDTGLVGSSQTLPDRERETEYCYRTARTSEPDRFSAVECIEVPASLGYMRFFGDPDGYFAADDFLSEEAIDVRVLVAPDRWTPDFWQMVAGQYDTPLNERAWRFGIDVFDALIANFSEDGFTDIGANRQFPDSFRDGGREWIRMTIEPTRGVQRYFTSVDGVGWTQLGDDLRFDRLRRIYDSVRPVNVGADRPNSDNPFAGKLYYLEIRQGVDGPVVADLDFRTPDQSVGGGGRWVDSQGNVFEARGDAWEYVPPER